MTLLEQSENMQWLWKGEPVKLKNLHYDQLHSILVTLKNYPRNWFGFSADAWQAAIALVIKNYHFERFKANLKISKYKDIDNLILNKINI